ncbi:MAG TPA: AraC family transcriptional regulator [Gemmatimonadales bacterium]|nr:AraC family transcriptional regulator [Gemmatimonadales bacterium]
MRRSSVFPHGDAHVMSSGTDNRREAYVQRILPERFPDTLVLGPGAPAAWFVCGYLGCDRLPFNPMLGALPRQMHLPAALHGWLGAFVRQVTEESRRGRAGAETVLTRLAELMFIEVLRRYLDALPEGGEGWLAALRDEVVGRALTLLHARPAHPWSLAELAREVASSRTNLATRFTAIVGQPPMQYLTQWRMQVAANLLVQGTAKVSAVAAEVGYASEAAFSRAFKKATGLAPGAYRESRRPRRG